MAYFLIVLKLLRFKDFPMINYETRNLTQWNGMEMEWNGRHIRMVEFSSMQPGIQSLLWKASHMRFELMADM